MTLWGMKEQNGLGQQRTKKVGGMWQRATLDDLFCLHLLNSLRIKDHILRNTHTSVLPADLHTTTVKYAQVGRSAAEAATSRSLGRE